MLAKLIITTSNNRFSDEINNLFGQLNITNPHPDLLIFKQEVKMGVEQSRMIKSFLSQKPYSAKGRYVIVENGDSLSIEAQNALLKTIEELPNNSLVVIGCTSSSNLLPTFLSRCQITILHDPHANQVGNLSDEISKLSKADLRERFELIEKAKDKESLLLELLHFFRSQLPKHSEFVTELLVAEKWHRQNVQIRSILEYLMLKMPNL